MCILAAYSALISAQSISIIYSSLYGDRLSTQKQIEFGVAPIPPKSMMLYLDKDEILINPAIIHQRIDGFGASFLEAGMICANTLAPQAKEQLFQSLFDTISGAGFSVMKSPMAGNDFMSAGDWYTYNDTPGDLEMKNFSIARDLEPNGLIPYIRAAKKYGHFMIQSPMDYPPDWMIKDTTRNKQDVEENYFPALAKYYLRYIQEYEKQGIPIDYISLLNEPGIYTKIPYSQISKLVSEHVGPLFEQNNIQTKIQMCEANERINAWTFFPAVLANPKTAKYIGGLAFHGYDYNRNFDKIAALKQAYPQYPIWMTEICHAYVCNTPKTMKLPNYDFTDGDFWGNQIFSDLEAGVSAWIYWNMILDEKGGPWLISEIHHNPDSNIQHPVVIVNRTTKEVTYTGTFYYLAHFSKFVRPGSSRIGSFENIDSIRCIAFTSPENKIVIQVLNSSNHNKSIKIRFGSKQAAVEVKGISITTLIWTK